MLFTLVLTLQASYADHEGDYNVKLVQPGAPDTDPSLNPIVLNIGDILELDIMVEFPHLGPPNLYAAEFHLSGGPTQPLRLFDDRADIIGTQIGLGPDTQGFESLDLPPVNPPAYPDRDELRTCDIDPVPAGGTDGVYSFIKGGAGDDQVIELQLLDQHHRPEWGDNWCGPTAVGISFG